jgi:RHS repeat-associated protein
MSLVGNTPLQKNAMNHHGVKEAFFDTFFQKKATAQLSANAYTQSISENFSRFSFTGKERDEETGYGYFGARYMDHELMTGWLSVDAMGDKYPSMSPYAYCAWNPVKLVDPDGEDPIYGKVLGVVRKIGDDGKANGKSYYVTGFVKYKVIASNIFGGYYTGSLAPSENIFHVPTGGVADDVEKTIELVKKSGEHPNSQVEYGAHALYNNGNARIWDPGSEMTSGITEDGYEYSKWTVTPFQIDGHPRQYGGNPAEIEFVWHVHPNYSDPSTADKRDAFSYEIKEGIKATWFSIGLNDGKVTFFSGTGSCHTINLEDFKKMSRQE